MQRDLISERSFTDRKQTLGIRAEILGWVLLVLAGLVWMMRGSVVERAATRQTATVEISLWPKGSAADVQQAFATAQKNCAVEATLSANTNPALHGGVFSVIVTSDTKEQALAGQAAMAKAMQATQAALPEDTRQFKVDPGDGNRTYPATNEAMRRLDLAMRVLAVLMAVAAQIVIVLGAYVQISTKPRDLWARLGLPFLFILVPHTAQSSRYSQHAIEPLWLFSPSLFFGMLAVSIVPALLVVWLTRRSKAT